MKQLSFRLLMIDPKEREVRSYLCRHGRKPVREYAHVLYRVPDRDDVLDLLGLGVRYFTEDDALKMPNCRNITVAVEVSPGDDAA